MIGLLNGGDEVGAIWGEGLATNNGFPRRVWYGGIRGRGVDRGGVMVGGGEVEGEGVAWGGDRQEARVGSGEWGIGGEGAHGACGQKG